MAKDPVKVAVLGGGHGGYAMAADLCEQGHEVRFWRRDARLLEVLEAEGGITVQDHRGARKVALALATSELGEAVRGAEVIVLPLPAPAQLEMARALAPWLSDGQVLYLTPGSFGSFAIAQELERAGCRARVCTAETATLPYLARKHGPATVAISGRAVRLPTGVFPARETAWVIERLKRLYPGVSGVSDALDAALLNAGPVIHPPLIVLNAAPLQHFPKWDIHNEGTQPAVRAVQDALDGERMAIREAWGYGAPHYPLRDYYTQGDWFYELEASARLRESRDWFEPIDLHAHRYVTEDIAYGLALMVSAGRAVGVPAPIAEGLLAIASAFSGIDYQRHGRTLGSLGLASASVAQVKDWLYQGGQRG